MSLNVLTYTYFFNIIIIIIDPLKEFLGAFATLLKATLSFVMSVSPSVRRHGTSKLPLKDFYEILYLSIFRKSVEKIQVFLIGSFTSNSF